MINLPDMQVARLRSRTTPGTMTRIAYVVFALGLIAPVVVLAQQHVIQPTDIANLKRVEGLAISPDGKLIAYGVETPVAAGKHRDAHIWIAATDGPGSARPFVYSGGTDSSPAWSPDGTHLGFLSDRANPLVESDSSPYHFVIAPGSERKDIPAAHDAKTGKDSGKGMQLWWIALSGGEAEPLTNIPGGIRAFKWSPDGKNIAFIRTDADTPQERDRKEAKNDESVADRDYHYDRLWIYDLAHRQARLLTTTDMNVDTADWSPDGSAIVARVSPTPRLDDYWRVSKVLLFDTKTGTIAKTIEEHSGYATPAFSKDGRKVAFSRFTKRGITDVHIVRDLARGAEIKLEDKLAGTIAEMHWAVPSNRLIVVQYVKAHSEVMDVDTDSFSVSPLSGIAVTSERFQVSGDGKSLSFIGESPTVPGEVYFWRDGHAERLTTTNPQVEQWSIGTQREISWENPNDHHAVHGVVVLPPGYQEGTKYKTIVHIHGGPEEAWTIGFNGNWYNYATMLASHGYVVLLPDPRGSEGQGPDFTEADFQDWGGGDFADVMAGVDYLIAKGITDPKQMAIGGWSFGGFMTAWTVTHTDRFKAAMVGAGVTDLFSMATTTDISPSYEQSYMGSLGADMAMYDRHSPVRYLANCHTPVLVLHGEADPRVPISQGEEFYHGLRFLGREAVMVRYPREPHIFTEREHQIDSLTRILDWYDAHLGK